MVNVEKFVISEVAPQQTNIAWFNPVDKKLRFYINGWQELADENTQMQSDWNQSDNTKVDFIKNKPEIPVPNTKIDILVSGQAGQYSTDGGVTWVTLNGGWNDIAPGTIAKNCSISVVDEENSGEVIGTFMSLSPTLYAMSRDKVDVTNIDEEGTFMSPDIAHFSGDAGNGTVVFDGGLGISWEEFD